MGIFVYLNFMKNAILNTLLVIDDDPIYHRLIQLLVDKYSLFNVTHSDNALHVLEYLDHNKSNTTKLPDLIFVDLNMPEISGWQFLDNYQKLLPFISKPIDVYITSSSIDPQDIAHSKEYPFIKSYIFKPISTDKLKELEQSHRH
jgi:CheY-like chemotaxis protein